MSAAFKLEKLYCAHCPLAPEAQAFSDRASVRTHLDTKHEIPRAKAEEGRDFYEGIHAMRIVARRLKVAQAAGQKAARFLMQPDYTVEDFLVDAGDEPWPALEFGAEFDA